MDTCMHSYSKNIRLVLQSIFVESFRPQMTNPFSKSLHNKHRPTTNADKKEGPSIK